LLKFKVALYPPRFSHYWGGKFFIKEIEMVHKYKIERFEKVLSKKESSQLMKFLKNSATYTHTQGTVIRKIKALQKLLKNEKLVSLEKRDEYYFLGWENGALTKYSGVLAKIVFEKEFTENIKMIYFIRPKCFIL
jgi:hypothetical protein